MDPYRILFPLGLAYALAGVGVWLLFLAGWAPYPGPQHASLMGQGFLFSFALGFLMTAVPRFTGTRTASRGELIAGTLLGLAPFAVEILPLAVPRSAAGLAILGFLAFYFAGRARQRSYSLPKHFVFIPLGLFLGLLGATLLLLSELGAIGGLWAAAGKEYLYQGTLLCFVLGIGGKLVSAILGWGTPPLVQVTPVGAAATTARIDTARWQAVMIAVSFFLVLGGPSLTFAGHLLRALVATWVAIEVWKPYRRPKAGGWLARGLWVSVWGLLLGLWSVAVVPGASVHGLHLMFVSGFGLMTVLVASRVTLAHGGHEMSLEGHSRGLIAVTLLLPVAAVTRALAPATTSYFNHLGYASGVWLLALGIWAAIFVPKILMKAEA